MALKGHMSYLEAVQAFIDEMSAVPAGLVELAMEADPDAIWEVTTPVAGDRAQIVGGGVSWPCLTEDGDEAFAEIVSYDQAANRYTLKSDDGEIRKASEEMLWVDREGALPYWDTLWMFKDPTDKNWLSGSGSIRKMSECGFRVFDSRFGYLFGIDGCGYDFKLEHFAPLYDARGLHWHSTDINGNPVAC